MKPAALAIGFVCAGLIGAVCANVFFPPEPAAPADTGAPDRIDARFDELEAEIDRVAKLVETQRIAPPISEEVKPEIEETKPLGEGSAAFIEDPIIRDARVSDHNETVAVIEDKVRKVIEEKQEQARQEREKAAAIKLAKQREDFLDKWTKALDLTDAQREQLSENWNTRVKVGRALQKRQQEFGPDATQQQREILKQETADAARLIDDELKKILSTEQYDKMMGFYEKARNRRR
jgi:hypothetical protein